MATKQVIDAVLRDLRACPVVGVSVAHPILGWETAALMFDCPHCSAPSGIYVGAPDLRLDRWADCRACGRDIRVTHDVLRRLGHRAWSSFPVGWRALDPAERVQSLAPRPSRSGTPA